MKIIMCDRFLFRPKQANVYCSKQAGHEGQHVFKVPAFAEGQHHREAAGRRALEVIAMGETTRKDEVTITIPRALEGVVAHLIGVFTKREVKK